jgi:hypothetical protein
LLKAHPRSLFSVKELDTRRHRRAINRRVKPAWKKRRVCNCPSCIPWHKDGNRAYFGELEPTSLRAKRLRAHARFLMADLSAFGPRLTGLLAELDRLEFPCFDGIEFVVDLADFPALTRHLLSIGYEVERVRREGQVALEVDGLEPFVVWARPPAGAPVLSLYESEVGFETVYGRSDWYLSGLAKRDC